MQKLLQQVQGQAWGYSWLPLGAVEAVVCLLGATILRPAGKLRQALASFTQAQQAIHAELPQQDVGIQVLLLPFQQSS